MVSHQHTVKLENNWSATFTNQGEFRMGCEYWDLLLEGPDHQSINFFKNKIIVVNDDVGKLASSCIELSKDKQFGYLTCNFDDKWVIDFTTQKIAPHFLRFNHRVDDDTLSAYEQVAFKKVREYVHLKNKLLYITFPFTEDHKLSEVLEEYIQIRRKQLEETYFRK